MKNTTTIITLPNELVFDVVNDALSRGKLSIIRVKGGSMYPFLNDGDTVLLKPFSLTDLKRGIIVLAKINGKMILHRLITYTKERVLLSGDANLGTNEEARYTDLIASAVCVYRGEKTIQLNKRWPCYLGLAWYRARPYRRILLKLLN